MVVLSHVRFAAGGCVVSLGLLIGGAGGGIAVADPGSNGSATHDNDGAAGSSPSSGPASKPATGLASRTASGPAGSLTDALRNTLQGTASTLSLSPKAGPQASSGVSRPNSALGGPGIVDQKKDDAGRVAAVPNLVAPVPNVTAPDPNVTASDSNVVAPVPNVVAPVPPNVVGSLTSLVASVPTEVVALITNVVAQVPGLVAAGSDVIAALVDMLTTVARGVVTQLQSDLSYLLGGAEAPPAVNVLSTLRGIDAGPATAAASSVLAAPPLAFLYGDAPRMPFSGNATAVASLGGMAMTHMGRDSSLVGTATLAPPNGASVIGPRLPFGMTFGEILVAASLAALAAVAMPGISGLAFSTAAGVGVGYRQAKADFALRTEGVARFARRGPLGVVRSASMVVVSARASRAQGLLDIDNAA